MWGPRDGPLSSFHKVEARKLKGLVAEPLPLLEPQFPFLRIAGWDQKATKDAWGVGGRRQQTQEKETEAHLALPASFLCPSDQLPAPWGAQVCLPAG